MTSWTARVTPRNAYRSLTYLFKAQTKTDDISFSYLQAVDPPNVSPAGPSDPQGGSDSPTLDQLRKHKQSTWTVYVPLPTDIAHEPAIFLRAQNGANSLLVRLHPTELKRLSAFLGRQAEEAIASYEKAKTYSERLISAAKAADIELGLYKEPLLDITPQKDISNT